MKNPKKLDKEIIEELIPRLNDEFTAFYAYRNIANWCRGEGFERAAKFFQKESDSELEHAKKIEDYIVDWNMFPDFDNIKPPKDINSLINCIEMGYELEYSLYEAYEDTSAKIFKMGEICTFDFLKFFRDTQIASVIEYSDMLNKLKGVDVEDKYKMLSLEKTIFG